MPKLISKTDNGWQLASTDQHPSWQDPEQWQPGQPLKLSGDTEPDPEYAKASAIAIDFPAIIDGRGLSLAVLLRTRIGFTGELRATGAIHEDWLHYLVRCGFDAIDFPDDREIETALNALSPYSEQYQSSVTQPEPAFRRVHRGGSA